MVLALAACGGDGGMAGGGDMSGGEDLAGAPDLATPDLAPAPPVSLTVMRTGQGSIDSDVPGIACGATCTASFPRGSKVRLRVTAAARAAFSGWGGACSASQKAAECELILDAATTVSASFAAKTCVASGWCQEASGTQKALYDVQGTGERLVFAVGAGGTLLRYDGASWAPQASGTMADLRGLSVVSPQVAWAVGSGGVALRWDGSGWAPVATGVADDLVSVAAFSAQSAYVASAKQLLRYDGTSFKVVAIPNFLGTINDLWAGAANDLWLGVNDYTLGVGMHMGNALLHYDGQAGWTGTAGITLKANGGLRSIWGAGGAVFGVGNMTGTMGGPMGCVWYRTGGSYSSSSVGCSALTAAFAPTGDELWMGGTGGVLKHSVAGKLDGAGPLYVIDGGTKVTINGLWGPRSGNIWGVGDTGTIIHLE